MFMTKKKREQEKKEFKEELLKEIYDMFCADVTIKRYKDNEGNILDGGETKTEKMFIPNWLAQYIKFVQQSYEKHEDSIRKIDHRVSFLEASQTENFERFQLGLNAVVKILEKLERPMKAIAKLNPAKMVDMNTDRHINIKKAKSFTKVIDHNKGIE